MNVIVLAVKYLRLITRFLITFSGFLLIVKRYHLVKLLIKKFSSLIIRIEKIFIV